MYKALIVDDEKLIRLGMRRAIPWDSIGINEVYTAKSGAEALDIIRAYKPEILITDIKMDKMNGLELIDLAKKFVPDVRVLVLTGHDEFEYARQCITLKVNEFFLKPIDENDLIEAVRRQVDIIKQNQDGKIEDINESRVRAVAEQANIENFLRNLTHDRVSDKQIKEFCSKYGYGADQPVQVAVLVPNAFIDSGKEEEYFTAVTVKNVCIGLIDAQNCGLTYIDDYGRIAIAFFVNKQKGSTLEWLHELSSILRDEFNQPPKMAVGNPASGLKNLYISYSDAVHLLEYENSGDDDIIQTKSAWSKDNLFHEAFGEMKNAMCANIGDFNKVLRIFDRFCQATESYNLSYSAIRRCCYEIASCVFYCFLCNSKNEADDRLGSFINSLMNISGEEQINLTRLFLIRLLEGGNDQNIHEVVDKAKCYIIDHLSEDLSVTDIAEFLYFTPNYLSRLFKKETGEGCHEYVVRKRIEKAKLLLENTNLKISKIAEMVGYNDTNYFSIAVKKNTGLSPKEYRKEFQKIK